MVVVGDVFTSEYEDKDGLRRSSLEMRATAVGPDLSRAIVRIEQPQPKPAEVVAQEPDAEEPHEAQEPEEATDLALSA